VQLVSQSTLGNVEFFSDIFVRPTCAVKLYCELYTVEREWWTLGGHTAGSKVLADRLSADAKLHRERVHRCSWILLIVLYEAINIGRTKPLCRSTGMTRQALRDARCLICPRQRPLQQPADPDGGV
jgi:hypothetical protein